MNDPTGFWHVMAYGIVAGIAWCVLLVGIGEAWRALRHCRMKRQLRTPPAVQDWLERYMQSGGRYLG